MNAKSFPVLMLLLLCRLLFPPVVHGNSLHPIGVVATEKVFTLSPPAYLNVLQTGTTWVHVQWPLVTGAVHYHVITHEVVSGLVVSDLNNIVFSATGLIINNLNAGTTHVSTIYAVDANGIESTTGTDSEEYDTIIIEVVANGFQMPQGGFGNWQEICTVPVNVQNACTFTWSTSINTYFNVKNTSDINRQINFMVHVSTSGITTQLFPNTGDSDYENGRFYFSNAPSGQAGEYVTVSYSSSTNEVGRLTAASPAAANPNGLLYRDAAGTNLTSGYPIYKIEPTEKKFGGSDQGAIRNESFLSTTDGVSGLSAAPNPFTDQLDVEIPFAETNDIIRINLYDLRGQLARTLQASGRVQIITLPTDDLLPGLYLLQVNTGNRSEVIKVMKTQ